MVVLVFVALICLIGLGSEVAFPAIISLQVMALAGTYEVSLLALTWRRLWRKPLPPGPWSLGSWGSPLNCVGILYEAYLFIYSAIPGVCPVTASNFNWAPVMLGGVAILSLVYYLAVAKRAFCGPVVHVIPTVDATALR